MEIEAVVTLLEGMDPVEVRAMGRTMQREADRIENNIVPSIGKLVGQIPGVWRGPDATKFQGWWHTHQHELRTAAKELHGLGQSALNNATEQDKASGVGRDGGHRRPSDHHIQTRVVKSGAAVSDVETTTTEEYQAADGTTVLRVTTGDSLDVNAKDILGIAALIPVSKGATKVLQVLSHGSLVTSMGGNGNTYEWKFDSKAKADRARELIQNEAGSIRTTGIVGPDRIQKSIEAAAGGNGNTGPGYHIVSWGTSTSKGSLDAGIEAGGLGLSLGKGPVIVSHGRTDTGYFDTFTSSSTSFDASAEYSGVGGDAGTGSVSEITVNRDASGTPTSLSIETVRHATVSASGSGADASVIGTKSTSTVETGSIEKVTATYDLTDPHYQSVVDGLHENGGDTLSASQMGQIAQGAANSGGATVTTEQVHLDGTETDHKVLFSYESQFKQETQHVSDVDTSHQSFHSP